MKLFRVTLLPLDDHENDPGRRLALMLKYALRFCGLKCVRFETTDPLPPKASKPPANAREAAD